MFRMLNQNEADLVYTLDQHIYDRNYIIAAEEPVACHFAASASHPLSSSGSLTLDDLTWESFILTEKGMSYPAPSGSVSGQPFHYSGAFSELGHTGLICRLLEKGLGVSYLPDYVTEQGVREGKLIRLHVPEVRIDIWKQLLYHRNKWISPGAESSHRLFSGATADQRLSFSPGTCGAEKSAAGFPVRRRTAPNRPGSLPTDSPPESGCHRRF